MNIQGKKQVNKVIIDNLHWTHNENCQTTHHFQCGLWSHIARSNEGVRNQEPIHVSLSGIGIPGIQGQGTCGKGYVPMYWVSICVFSMYFHNR